MLDAFKTNGSSPPVSYRITACRAAPVCLVFALRWGAALCAVVPLMGRETCLDLSPAWVAWMVAVSSETESVSAVATAVLVLAASRSCGPPLLGPALHHRGTEDTAPLFRRDVFPAVDAARLPAFLPHGDGVRVFLPFRHGGQHSTGIDVSVHRHRIHGRSCIYKYALVSSSLWSQPTPRGGQTS